MTRGETYAIVQAMKATGNRPGVIAQWKEAVAQWAQMMRTDPNAAAVNALPQGSNPTDVNRFLDFAREFLQK